MGISVTWKCFKSILHWWFFNRMGLLSSGDKAVAHMHSRADSHMLHSCFITPISWTDGALQLPVWARFTQGRFPGLLHQVFGAWIQTGLHGPLSLLWGSAQSFLSFFFFCMKYLYFLFWYTGSCITVVLQSTHMYKFSRYCQWFFTSFFKWQDTYILTNIIIHCFTMSS